MKKLLSLLLATMMIIGVPSMVFADNVSQIIGDGNTVVFIDVPANYWAKDQIEYFANQGIVDGYTDGSFKPEAGVTREEFCKLLVSTFKQPLETPATPTFADVAENRWSYPYVEVCRDFLTGYANPFGGLPSFHPTEYATREDIAVALVRMMGFTDKDASNPNYAAYNFRDGGNISPNILAYVSIACERGLISGYPDGTFGPTKGITRAETVVLLNRATKQAVTNINSELEISANVIYSSDKKTATINIVAEEGTTVTVNGESVKMSSNYYGEYEGNYVYKFEAEGSKDFTVEGKRAGKKKQITVNAKYEIGAPTLTLNQSNQTVTDKEFKLSGKATDENSSVSVTVNGTSVNVDSWNGNWSKSYTLTEGDNTFEVVATNESGKQEKKSITITYTVGAPTLTLNQSNQTVTDKEFKLSGKATDANYSVTVTINGTSVNVDSWNGNWSKSYTLTEGDNTFEVIATNENGKQTKKSITVTYTVGAPTLTLNQSNQTVTSKEFKLSGKATDANYSVTVTINGTSVNVDSWNGNWSKSYTLTEGDNTFEVVATNENGKQTKKSITVTYSVGAPTLTLNQSNQSVTTKEFKLSGKATDDNYSVTVTVNGTSVNVDSWNGNWSKTYTLTEGANNFEVIATNENGKQTKKSITVTYTVGAPTLTLNQSNQTVSDKEFKLSGKATDDNYSVTVTVNGTSVNVDSWNGNWSKTYTLTEGANDFEIIATNENGKQTKKNITITFKVGNPKIQFINCPESTTKSSITIKGKITECNEGAMLFINDEEVNVNYNGEFSKNLTLKEGTNTFKFRAVNNYGKEDTITKTITYTPESDVTEE